MRNICRYDFAEFLIRKLFNIQYFLHQRSEHYKTASLHPDLSKAFQQYQLCNRGCHGLEDLNVRSKINKANYLGMYRLLFLGPCCLLLDVVPLLLFLFGIDVFL